MFDENDLGDILYTFGVGKAGQLVLHNYPTTLMELKIPKGQTGGPAVWAHCFKLIQKLGFQKTEIQLDVVIRSANALLLKCRICKCPVKSKGKSGFFLTLGFAFVLVCVFQVGVGDTIVASLRGRVRSIIRDF